MRTAAYKDTEEAVLQWFKTARDQNVPVSGPLLIAKAQEFASQLGDDFKCTTGWLSTLTALLSDCASDRDVN